MFLNVPICWKEILENKIIYIEDESMIANQASSNKDARSSQNIL